MESKNKVAIVMTIHNRIEATLRCLKSLGDYVNSLDIYITDDGSTDNSADVVKAYYPNIYILQGEGNLFWNRGMYVAFGEAMKQRYDYYLWLNNDTYVIDGFLDNLITVAKTYNDKAIICGATISEETGDVTYGGYTASSQMIGLAKEDQECAFASGNILLIPYEVAMAVGNLDYYYKHALGDFDYEAQARKKGFKIVQARENYGYCERHPTIPVWRDASIPFKKRWENLYSPLGRPPFDFFYYHKKNTNYFTAIAIFIILNIRCIFPRLWKKSYDLVE